MAEIQTTIPEIWASIVEFVFPPICSGCGEFFDSTNGICLKCKSKMFDIPSPVCLTCDILIESDSICSFCRKDSFPLYYIGDFTSPLREIVLDVKFHSVITPLQYLSTKLIEKFTEQIMSLGGEFLVPVPLHSSREYFRGYNQATRFAEYISAGLAIPLNTNSIYRVKRGRPQSRIADVSARLKNVDGAFAAEQDEASQRLILVDDVVTSGATVKEAKKTLEAAGHSVVGVISIAHGFRVTAQSGSADGLNIYKPAGGRK